MAGEARSPCNSAAVRLMLLRATAGEAYAPHRLKCTAGELSAPPAPAATLIPSLSEAAHGRPAGWLAGAWLLAALLLYYAAQSEMRPEFWFYMQSEISTAKKAHVVRFRMVFLTVLRGAFFQSARAESCTFPLLTISSPCERGLPLPAGQPASQPARILHA